MSTLSAQLADILNPEPGFKDPEDDFDIGKSHKLGSSVWIINYVVKMP